MKRATLHGCVARLLGALGLLGVVGCSALQAPVARRVDGVTTEGRFIEPDAYALYAVAALREAHGKWGEALKLYQRALEIDGRGPEIKTRIGAVACRLHEDKLADRAFAGAARAAADYGPLWFELAQCRKARGDLAGAEGAALEAVRLDPERYEASLLAADLAELRGAPERAWRMRDALATHAHGSRPAQRALLAAARRHHDAARAARAEATLAELTASGAQPSAPRSTESALTALERGDVAAAKLTAEALLGADPSNADALVIALAAADLQQDHATFDSLLQQASDAGTPVSPRLLDTLAALVARRVGADAAAQLRAQP